MKQNPLQFRLPDLERLAAAHQYKFGRVAIWSTSDAQIKNSENNSAIARISLQI